MTKGFLAKERLFSLDVFRGITIAGMILVDCSGSDSVYPTLQHAAWNGWTLADLVFPSFLVIMGISLVISFSRRLARRETTTHLTIQIIRRTAIIFAFGMIISFFIFNPPIGIRVPGVLQRISICYLFCSILYLTADPPLQVLVCAALLVGYGFLLTHIPVPGQSAVSLTPGGNIACYLDGRILGRHKWAGEPCDPEGILSTLSAIATTIIGVLAGEWLISKRARSKKTLGLAAMGLICASLGFAWSFYFPINKHIWTSSYALFTGGLALLGFSFCYEVIDGFKIKQWGKAFEVLGRNPLLAYFLSGLFYGIQEFIQIPMKDGSHTSLKLWIGGHLFGSWLSPMNASLAYAVGYLLLCIWGMGILYRKNIFLKI